MGALFSKIRKLIKSNKKKLIVVNYSPDIYEVSSILEKDIKDEHFFRTFFDERCYEIKQTRRYYKQ